MKNNSTVMFIISFLLICVCVVILVIGAYVLSNGWNDEVATATTTPTHCVLDEKENTMCMNGVIKKSNPEFLAGDKFADPYVDVFASKQIYCTCPKAKKQVEAKKPEVKKKDVKPVKHDELQALKDEIKVELVNDDVDMEYKILKADYEQLSKDLEFCRKAVADVIATNDYLITKFSQEVENNKIRTDEIELQLKNTKKELEAKTKKLKANEKLLKDKEAEIKRLKKGKKK